MQIRSWTVTITDMDYSVLMSVYSGEKPEYLRCSIQSILDQTVPSNDIVIVCDGPLTDELNEVLTSFADKIRTIRLPDNGGLGNALNKGLGECLNDIVARMDSDDIALPDRMAKQLSIFTEDKDIALVSGTVEEFSEDISVIVGRRDVPLSYEEIKSFSRKRNPMNHPAVMFRKTAVIKAGSYNEDYPYFEDYSLWIRILMNGERAVNLKDTLVYMRVDEGTFTRRGGVRYASDMLRFHRYLLRSGWSSVADYISGALPHAVVCILPNRLRAMIYKKLH